MSDANATFSSVAAAIVLPNIDTDTIIPIEWCINRSRPNFDVGLFRRWRFDDDGKERDNFVLNLPPFRDAQIIIAGENFGCGSSREMAVWALADFGIRCIIAPSFGEIFYNNCFQNGVIAAVVAPSIAQGLGEIVSREVTRLAVDLRELAIRIEPELAQSYDFELDELRRDMLTQGIDSIAATLKRSDAIDAFEALDRAERAWIHDIATPFAV